MSAFQPLRSPEPPRRRSYTVTLVLLSGIGLVGGLAAWEAWQRSQENTAEPQPATPPVSADQTYPNNYHLPGAGYYHAPYHAWFPFPYNYHDPARGYFAGGLWNLAPLALALNRSQPSADAVAAANAGLIARRKQEEAIYRNNASSGGSGARSTWFRSGGGSYSSPSAPVGKTNGSSVIRGGFGSSGHGSSGGGA
jgi:hypothetical protein